MSKSRSSSSSNGPENEACSLAVSGLLEELRIPWTLIGAIAAGYYRSKPRTTTDIDYLVAWDEGLGPGLVDAGFDVRVLKDQGEPHLIRARRNDGQADLIIATTEYQQLALDRAREHVLTVEDVLIHKLIAWRPRDQDDIDSILSTGISYDNAYVSHWATEWGVENRWYEALDRLETGDQGRSGKGE